MVWDWWVSRAGPICFFNGLSCSMPNIVFYSFSLGAAVFGLIGCTSLSLSLALPAFFLIKIIDPTLCGSRFSTGRLLAIEDFTFFSLYRFMTWVWFIAFGNRYTVTSTYNCLWGDDNPPQMRGNRKHVYLKNMTTHDNTSQETCLLKV